MAEDTQQQILDELRNQTGLIRKYTKQGKIALVGALVFVVILLALTPLMPRIQRSLSASGKSGDPAGAGDGCPGVQREFPLVRGCR